MQGPQGRNKGAKGAVASLQYLVCVCVSPGYKSRTIRNSPVPRKKKTKNPMGGIQRQDPDLQQKLSTDRFRPDAVVLCPRCLQWIFVYSQISARPLAPRQAVIWALLPSHSVSQVFIIPVPDHSFPHVLLLNQKEKKKKRRNFSPPTLVPSHFLTPASFIESIAMSGSLRHADGRSFFIVCHGTCAWWAACCKDHFIFLFKKSSLIECYVVQIIMNIRQCYQDVKIQ